VANNGDDTVSIPIGNGDGSFKPAVNYTVPAATAVAVADFNGDGRRDLAATNGYSGNVSILLGNGEGTFQMQPVSPIDGT